MIKPITIKEHINLLIMSFFTWGLFVLIGLPDYYQSWHFNSKFIICILITIVYVPMSAYLIKKMFKRQDYFENSIWLALYLTVPLFTFDIFYIMGFLGAKDLSFVTQYWYLTFFYFSFWLQFPLVALLMERNLPK